MRHGLVKPADVTCGCPGGPLCRVIHTPPTTPIAHRVTSIAIVQSSSCASSAGQVLLLRPWWCPCRRHDAEFSHPCAPSRALAPSCRSPSELSLGYILGAVSTCAAFFFELVFLSAAPFDSPGCGGLCRCPSLILVRSFVVAAAAVVSIPDVLAIELGFMQPLVDNVVDHAAPHGSRRP